MLLFDALKRRGAVRWGGGLARNQPGVTLLATQPLLLVFFFSPAL
jgi:hypothetical protein